MRARIGIIFADADPWMAGAVIEQGQLAVGDRALLRLADGRTLHVTITAIREDATHAEVAITVAPSEVFLSFRPETETTLEDSGAVSWLLGTDTP